MTGATNWTRLTIGGAGILFGDRTGGVSAPPFDTANAGYSRGDDPAAVAENRRRVGAALGGAASDPDRWFCLRQVHGAEVIDSTQAEALPAGDASVTTDPDGVLAILTADCGPLALVAPGATGAVHAGWRGVAAGVVEAAVTRTRALGGDVTAVLGPCVHPCCYEFSPADLAELVDRYGPGVESRTRDGKPALDLPAAIRAALDRAGVREVEDRSTCTHCSPHHFSHRRDGRTGLQVMLVTGPGGSGE
jgi:YfiH family protein